MTPPIVLDSGPLALLVQRVGFAQRELCRQWLTRHLSSGSKFFVPEIIEYELRRELLRLNKTNSLKALDVLLGATPDRVLVLKSADLKLAAQLWAKSRQAGRPTTDPHALDIDMILCAQATNTNFGPSKPIVATSNISHLPQFVDARAWQTI